MRSPSESSGKPGARKPRPLAVLVLWLPVLAAFAIVGGAFLAFMPGKVGTRSPPPRAAVWDAIAHGEFCSWHGTEALAILRATTGARRFRVEIAEQAFEAESLELALKSVLRERLSALQPGDSFALRIAEAVLASRQMPQPGQWLSGWSFRLEESIVSEETWYTAHSKQDDCGEATEAAVPGSADGEGTNLSEAPYAARTREDLKQKLLEGIARELVARLATS